MTDDDAIYALSEIANLATEVVEAEEVAPAIRAGCYQLRDDAIQLLLELQCKEAA